MTLGSKSASVLVKAIVGPSCHRRPCFRRQIRMAGRTCQMYFRGTASHPNSTCCELIDALRMSFLRRLLGDGVVIVIIVLAVMFGKRDTGARCTNEGLLST